MSWSCPRAFRLVIAGIAIMVFAVACGADDSSDSDTADSVSRAAGTLGDPDLSLVVNELAAGFGGLGQTEQQAVQGAADGDAVCDHVAGPRARPQVSQIEVEVVTLRNGCLHFDYDVANFRSVVDDIRALRRPEDVLAVSPLLLDYRLNQIESEWPVEAIDGLAALSRTGAPTGQGITIAVIDSGIDADHPSLMNASVRRAPGSGTGDYTETGHGTIAATIIFSPIGSAERGIAPGAELLDVPADLCDPASCGCDPCAPMTPAEAIRWASDNGADIISMSFGYQPAPKPAWWQLLLDAEELTSATDTIELALAYAEANGVAMAAAAGNCASGPSARCEAVDQFEIPAGHGSVIGVSALAADEAGQPTRAWYSTRQSYVELAAPGNLVIIAPDGETIEKNGTSYATPFVSASLAVLLGADGPLVGQPASHAVARQLLIDTATDLDPTGRDPLFGHGQLQLNDALDAAADYAAANPPPTPTAAPDSDS